MQGSNTLSVAPLSSGKYGYYGSTTRGAAAAGMSDYQDHRHFMGPTMNDYDDPYGRIMFREGGGHVPAGRRPSHPGTGTMPGPGPSVSGHTVPHSAHRMQHSLSHPRIQSHQGRHKYIYNAHFEF